MSEVRIPAEPRTEFGKGAARRVRRDHKVPAVLYGHGTEPRHVSLPGHELMMALKGGSNTLLRLTGLEGGEELALPRFVQRDPVRGDLEHIDLLLVQRGEKVSVEVPVVPQGDVESGGLLEVRHTTVHLEAEATHIPSEVVVSVAGLAVGASILAGDITLPAGVTLLAEPDEVILHVLSPSASSSASEGAADTASA